MKQVALLCGRDKIGLALPDRARVFDLPPAPALADPAGAVEQALASPIGSRPLKEIAAAKTSACVVISDFTRPVPNRIILPPLLQTLEQAGIDRSAITILIATGMHRPNLDQELIDLVGEEIAAGYKCINHYCRDKSNYRRVAEIEGAPIEINSHYLEADLKILTGLIEPHMYAGFSGGRKSILPGLSSYETMKFMHSFKVIDHPGAVNLELDGNPFHQYGLQVAELVGVDFIINCSVNRERRMTGVFAGHYDQAHRAGCAEVEKHTTFSLDAPADLVITSGGGFPLDATYYQVSKGLIAAADILKPGGTIVIAAECRERIGGQEFSELMLSGCRVDGFNQTYSDPANFVIDQWCAQTIFQAQGKAGKVYSYCPNLTAEEHVRMGLTKVDDLQATIDRLAETHGNIVATPDGPYIVGRIGRG